MAGNTVIIAIKAQVADAQKGLSKVQGTLGKLGSAFGDIGKPVLAGVGAFGAATAIAVKAASDQEQAVGGVEAVFGKYASTVKKTSADAAKQFGLSATDYDSAATLIGSQLKNAGVPMDQLSAKTDKFIGLGADLAAQFGGSSSDAIDAMSSALKGEFDPLERYGVTMNATTLQTAAMAKQLGLSKKPFSQWTQSQKEAVIQAELFRQSGEKGTNALGQWGKQSGTLAEQTQILKAKFDNIVAKLGTAFLPTIEKVADKVSEFADNLTSSPGFAQFTKWLTDNAPMLLKIAGIVGLVAGAFVVLGPILNGIVATMKIFSAVMTIVNLVMAANPVTLIVLGIIALIAAIVLVITHWQQILAVLQTVWAWVSGVFVAGWKAMTSWFSSIWGTVLGAIQAGWAAIMAFFGSIPAKAKAIFATIVAGIVYVFQHWTLLGIITSNWGAIMSFFQGIPGKVKAVFSAAVSWLATAGKNIMTGLKNGITGAWGSVTSWLGGIGSKVAGAIGDAGSWLYNAGKNMIQGMLNGISSAASGIGQWIVSKIPAPLVGAVKSALGIHSPSRVFMGIGQNVVKGLINGLAPTGISAAMSRLSGSLTGGLSLAGGVGGIAGGAVVYNVTVQTLKPDAEIGRQVVQSINEYKRIGGSL